MDIAAASISLSMAQTQLSAGYALTEKAMDNAQVLMDGLLDMLPQAPSFGHKLDIRV